jgi:hypothetical protein
MGTCKLAFVIAVLVENDCLPLADVANYPILINPQLNVQGWDALGLLDA